MNAAFYIKHTVRFPETHFDTPIPINTRFWYQLAKILRREIPIEITKRTLLGSGVALTRNIGDRRNKECCDENKRQGKCGHSQPLNARHRMRECSGLLLPYHFILLVPARGCRFDGQVSGKAFGLHKRLLSDLAIADLAAAHSQLEHAKSDLISRARMCASVPAKFSVLFRVRSLFVDLPANSKRSFAIGPDICCGYCILSLHIKFTHTIASLHCGQITH